MSNLELSSLLEWCEDQQKATDKVNMEIKIALLKDLAIVPNFSIEYVHFVFPENFKKNQIYSMLKKYDFITFSSFTEKVVIFENRETR